jgi:hypothetical protein
VQCTFMPKKAFTTRIDGDVLALAQQLAEIERRSVTSILEVAVIDYGRSKGLRPSPSLSPSNARAADPRYPERRSIGPESEVRGGPEAAEQPEVQTDD